MPAYLYKAKDKTRTISGELTGTSEEDAIAQVERLGYLPIKVVLKSSSSSSAEVVRETLAARPFSGKKIRTKDLNAFTRQLAGLVKSKTAIFKALEIVARESRHPGLKAVAEQIKDRVKNGSTLSEAMEAHACFPRHYVSMISAGEKSGLLQPILLDLVETSEKNEETASKFRSALAYPILMGVVGVGTVFAMIVFVMPQMVSMYSSTGQKLPGTTQLLLSAGNFVRHRWYVLIGLLAVSVLGVQKSGVIGRNRIPLSRLTLAMPLLGPYLLQRSVARFCRTLSMLVSSGIEIRSAIASAVPTIGSAAFEVEMSGLADGVAGGSTFTEALKKVRRFPTYASSLISVGEEAGALHEALRDVALAYEREADEKLRIFSTLLEPLMILVIGSAVGFVVFSMLMPIFQFDVK